MSVIKAVFHLLPFVFVLAGATCNASELLPEEFLAEYGQAAARLKDNARDVSSSVKIYKIQSGEKTLFKTIEYKAAEDNKLVTYWFEDDFQEKGQSAITTIVFGPKKSFRMSNIDDEKFRALLARPRGEIDSVLVSVAEPIFASFAVFGEKTLTEANDDEKISVEEIKQQDNLFLVTYKFTNESLSGFSGQLLIDPIQSWVIVEHHLFDQAGKVQRSREMRYTDESNSHPLPLIKGIEEESLESGELVQYVVEIESSPQEMPSEDVFTLSHYGLPETLGDPPAPSWRLFGMLVLICVLAFIGFQNLKRQKAAR
ncbi:hypothetical protein [Roseiconus lacunae]|uniref:hypothetical protein n=1 Tax=Roseiconus lacunae TaxID=2605694 RepID=UPI0011F19255|nr:hypothetical protein [Roseiconus lacunae]